MVVFAITQLHICVDDHTLMKYQLTFIVYDAIATPYGTESYFRIVNDSPRNSVSLAVIVFSHSVLVKIDHHVTYGEIFSSMKITP